MDDSEDERYRAPALDKGLDILELLAGVDGGLTQAEIAKKLDRSPNEFYRMLDRSRPINSLFLIAVLPSSSPSRRRRTTGASRSGSAPTSACSTPVRAMCCWPSARRKSGR